jgi:hypothetical protein
VCELASVYARGSPPFVWKKKESVDTTSQPDRPHHVITHTYTHTSFSFSDRVTSLQRSDVILRVDAGIHRRTTFFYSRWSTVYVFFPDLFLCVCHGNKVLPGICKYLLGVKEYLDVGAHEDQKHSSFECVLETQKNSNPLLWLMNCWSIDYVQYRNPSSSLSSDTWATVNVLETSIMFLWNSDT